MDEKYIETIITKSFLNDHKMAVMVISSFDYEYFSDEGFRNIFHISKNYFEKYKEVPNKDIIIGESNIQEKLVDRFKEMESIDDSTIENFDYVRDLTNNYLKEKAMQSAILKSADLLENRESLEQIKNLIEDALLKDLNRDVGLDYFSSIKERLMKIINKQEKKIPTYFQTWDEILNGGFTPYTFSVIAAVIHGFKTNTLSNLASRQVLNGHNVVIVSMEMSELAYAQRIDAHLSGLDINRMYVSKNKVLELGKSLSNIKKSNIGKLFIKEMPTGSASVNDIKKYLYNLSLDGFKPDIVYVDYINIMKAEMKDSSNLYMTVKKIAEECRAMSLEFDCPLVTVTQLNRQGYFVELKEIGFNFISDSMGVGATADFMMIHGIDEDSLVYQNEVHSKIQKNRIGGRVGDIIKFYYDKRNLRMYDETEIDKWLDDIKISGDERKMSKEN